ncbi:unnamed protein product [Lota lota]
MCLSRVPPPQPTYGDTSPGCGDLHAGPNDPGLTSGSGIGSAQPTCCQQLLLRNALPSSLSDKGSASQDNKSLAVLLAAGSLAVLLAAGSNPTAKPEFNHPPIRTVAGNSVSMVTWLGLHCMGGKTVCDASYHVLPSTSG